MNESVARKSQETLGKVIKKPHLTEKLLSKPPFRFLHDIFTEVIRTTGFLKGLYGEAELKSENVKDKDSKIAFLQKAIDAVMLVSGEPLAAKPVKIIAGQEPERTNELLQAIAKCCLSKLSSDEAVKRVLAGEKLSTSRSQDKENRQERKVTKEGSASRERESKKEDKEKRRDAERSKEKSRDREKHKERERDKEREKRRDRGSRRDVEKEQEREKRSERERGKEKHKETEEIQEDRTDKKSRTSEETSTSHAEEPSQRCENAGAAEAQSPARIPRPSSAKGQRRRPTAGHQDHSDSDGDAEVPSRENIENGTVSDPALSQKTQRRPPRPSSARPAAPRVWRQDAEGSPAERLGSGKPSAPVIIEGKKLSEDEDDEDGQFVVEEAAPSASDLPEVQHSSLELEVDGTHGGLVKKILETKKDYESSPSSKEQERWLVSEASRRKEREAVLKELERLRGAVQTVCRSALPLGKIMDYIQEDMDSMQKELQTWRQENKRHAQALLQEQRITDSVVDPLKAELTELEQSIRDQQDKICALKSIVLKNEEKIFRMVSSLSSSSQT